MIYYTGCGDWTSPTFSRCSQLNKLSISVRSLFESKHSVHNCQKPSHNEVHPQHGSHLLGNHRILLVYHPKYHAAFNMDLRLKTKPRINWTIEAPEWIFNELTRN